jgi:hypothetical protein
MGSKFPQPPPNRRTVVPKPAIIESVRPGTKIKGGYQGPPKIQQKPATPPPPPPKKE